MSIFEYFSTRNAARHGRSGLMSTSVHGTKKMLVRERDEAGESHHLREESIGPVGLVFCVLLLTAAVFVLDYGVLPPALSARSDATADIAARLDFHYSDPDELARQLKDAADKAPRVYVEDPAWVDTTLKDLTELISIVEVSKSAGDARDRSMRFPAESQLVAELFEHNENMGGRKGYLSTVLLERIRASLQIIANDGVLNNDDLKVERNKGGERVIVRITPSVTGVGGRKTEERKVRVNVDKLNSVANVIDDLPRKSWRESLPQLLARHLTGHLQTRITGNLKLDEQLTEAQRELARFNVGSGDVRVKRGDILVHKDEKITPSAIDKLHHEYMAYKASLPVMARVRHIAGLATVVFGVLLVFLLVVSRIDRKIFERRRPLVMLGLFSLLTLGAAKGLMLAGYSAVLTPLVFVGMVASLAFGQAVTLMTLVGLAVLTAIAGVGWEAMPREGVVPAVSIALLAGAIAAALPAHLLRDRWDLLKYGFVGGLVQGVLIAGMSQLGEGRVGVPTLFPDSLLGVVNGTLCGLLVLGSLPLVESLFGILTNIRLFELSDMNQPALKRIQNEAPGTFTHTLQVRSLAEPAADSINANTRLVSTGVLYHDLGKTLKPEYFVENQMDAEERHRRLRPSVSALLITAHVKDGIELAREYGLPQQIIDFIPEHHGTTLVSYFYHTAKKNAEANPRAEAEGAGVESVQEAFFRYPGPKPQSRESAIVMLADTIEAATRTLANPSAARLRAFVHELIMDKMLDGQLDECNLTFADLALIEEAFLRVLVTRYHSRVRYPGQEDETHGERPRAATTIIETPPVKSNTTTVSPPPTPVPTRAALVGDSGRPPTGKEGAK